MSDTFARILAPGDTAPHYAKLENHTAILLTRAPWLGGTATQQKFEVKDCRFLAPVEPSKIVCIGLNYHAHVAASFSADKAPDYPLVFLKPPSSIINPGDNIVHPSVSERVDYEAELGLVIGKTAKNVLEAEAITHVFGYTCANDVTARDLQKKDGQWSRAKGFDTFCPVGPHIVTDLNWQDLSVEAVHNGAVTQSGRTSQMIFKIPFLVSYISKIMTLNPGDLICTATPSGIQPMKPGDTIEVRIEGVGSLVNGMLAQAV